MQTFLLWICAFFPLITYGLVLENEVNKEIELNNFPVPLFKKSEILDVAIIGAGLSGSSLCMALREQGITNTEIFETNSHGFEGPWMTYARMRTLRSKKDLPYPILGIPHLHFRLWYEAVYGNWENLGKIPTSIWAEYLRWYRQILRLPVQNHWNLTSIEPQDNLLKLHFSNGESRLARKVVLATGRGGCGGGQIPPFVQNLPKSAWFHTTEKISPLVFNGKRVCVVGCCASAFDVAAVALESGAARVDMLMRRAALPQKSLFDFPYWPAFYYLRDEKRIEFFQKAFEQGTPPPLESIHRVERWSNFALHAKTAIECATYDKKRLHLQTNQGPMEADLLILATGYAVNVYNVPELSGFARQILLWGHKVKEISPKLASFPYLGEHFQFLEKHPGYAPYLKNIHCFNFGAFLSHGGISASIDLVAIGIDRLAKGIAVDLFLDDFGAPEQRCAVED